MLLSSHPRISAGSGSGITTLLITRVCSTFSPEAILLRDIGTVHIMFVGLSEAVFCADGLADKLKLHSSHAARSEDILRLGHLLRRLVPPASTHTSTAARAQLQPGVALRLYVATSLCSSLGTVLTLAVYHFQAFQVYQYLKYLSLECCA